MSNRNKHVLTRERNIEEAHHLTRWTPQISPKARALKRACKADAAIKRKKK